MLRARRRRLQIVAENRRKKSNIKLDRCLKNTGVYYLRAYLQRTFDKIHPSCRYRACNMSCRASAEKVSARGQRFPKTLSNYTRRTRLTIRKSIARVFRGPTAASVPSFPRGGSLYTRAYRKLRPSTSVYGRTTRTHKLKIRRLGKKNTENVRFSRLFFQTNVILKNHNV